MYTILAGGLFLGLLIFSFFFIISKFKRMYFLAPLLTFLTALGVVLYSILIVRGFEAMGYIFLAGGIFLISVLGTALLPALTKSTKLRKISLWEKIALFVLPVVFFTTIFAVGPGGEDYWIIHEGQAVVENDTDSHYRVSTIYEGNRQIEIKLGKDHMEKKVEVQEVNQNEHTEVIVRLVENKTNKNTPSKASFISIGLDEIKEPLTVRTTEGEELPSAIEVVSEQ
ncbi:hypothetical protein SAMN05216353_16513 [Halobacillus alkaliphilus]|uniref:YesK-like protein n=1 Tax=Halobacillus alkaliphilus TaxID=396056 RepID=A0A1I2TBB0_9BACI|nr:hypothetical protein [Halobacillus alkaliphilus]SFG62263.1 hypothetical protein SAMN05216353_16513 [Halobacillus alkaliphilus]